MNRTNLAAGLIILAAGLMYSLNIKANQIGHLNDDAYYINAARWFAGVQAEQKELSSRSLGFSFLLVPAACIAGDSLLPFRITSLIFTLASLWLVYLIFRKRAPPAVCFSVLLLTAFNHMNLIFSTMVMSEEAYLFFSLLAVWVFIRRENKGFSYGEAFFQALTLAALSYIRPEGFLLAFTVFTSLLAARRLRNALYSIFFFLLLVLPLVTNSFGIGSNLNKYMNELLFPMLYAGLPTVIKANFIYFLKEIPATAFFTEVIRSRMGIFEISASFLFTAVIFSGMYISVRGAGQKMSFRSTPSMMNFLMALYLILYTAFHVIWPAKGARFIIPLLPFIYYFFFSALMRWIPAVIPGKSGRKVIGVLTALILMIFAYQNYLIFITPPRTLFPETFAYVKTGSVPDDIFVSESSERFFLKTGIKAISPSAYLTADDFYYSLITAGVTRAAFGRLPRLSTEYGEFPTPSASGIKRYAFYLENSARFEKEYENKNEGTAVYRLKKTFADGFKKAYDIMIPALNDIKEGRLAEGEKKLKKTLEICPLLTKAADNLLLIYIDSGRLDKANELLKKTEKSGAASHLTLFLAGELCE
ncbi:hypothetical protein KJ633_03490, partial [bacterium]|nr:hypothetical protein [bacterium]MBU3955501.1 hypothetical protein [bacterium]